MYWANRLLSKVKCIWLLLINETEAISIDTLSGKDTFTIHTDTHEKQNNTYCSKKQAHKHKCLREVFAGKDLSLRLKNGNNSSTYYSI